VDKSAQEQVGRECACLFHAIPVLPTTRFFFYLILNGFSAFPVLIALKLFMLQTPKQWESVTGKETAAGWHQVEERKR
jgi:hypothetical protein